MNYATFWQRFAAAWIDIFVLLPLMVLDQWVGSASRGAALALVIPLACVYLAYTIYCHGRFGQTVGKRVMGIHLARTDGGRIGWREAWLRSSVDLFFSALGVVASFVALSTITDANYYGVDWTQRTRNLQSLEPSWLAWTDVAFQIWIWSEVVVMLFNRERRALHDFIAGTVVLAQRAPSAVPA